MQYRKRGKKEDERKNNLPLFFCAVCIYFFFLNLVILPPRYSFFLRDDFTKRRLVQLIFWLQVAAGISQMMFKQRYTVIEGRVTRIFNYKVFFWIIQIGEIESWRWWFIIKNPCYSTFDHCVTLLEHHAWDAGRNLKQKISWRSRRFVNSSMKKKIIPRW